MVKFDISQVSPYNISAIQSMPIAVNNGYNPCRRFLGDVCMAQTPQLSAGFILRGKPVGKCIDCGKEIIGEERCWNCHIAYRKTEEYRQMQFERKKAAHARGCYDNMPVAIREAHERGCYDNAYIKAANRKRSEGAKKAWQRGDFDGVFGDEWAQKISISKKGQEPWNKGKTDVYSESTKARMSESHQAAQARGDYDNVGEAVRAAWQQGCYDGVFTEETFQKRRENARAAHARGCYDGVYQSPTTPEGDIMFVLDTLNEPYEFNELRLASYSYDFYLPARSLIIEYDGWFWHHSDWAIEKGKLKTDSTKDKLARENGFTLIRLVGSEHRDLSRSELILAIMYILAWDENGRSYSFGKFPLSHFSRS